jgi:hypothetical protein
MLAGQRRRFPIQLPPGNFESRSHPTTHGPARIGQSEKGAAGLGALCHAHALFSSEVGNIGWECGTATAVRFMNRTRRPRRASERVNVQQPGSRSVQPAEALVPDLQAVDSKRLKIRTHAVGRTTLTRGTAGRISRAPLNVQALGRVSRHKATSRSLLQRLRRHFARKSCSTFRGG